MVKPFKFNTGFRTEFILLISLNVNFFAGGQSLEDAKALHTNLFTGYKKEILPRHDYSKPLEVGITFFMLSVNAFYEVQETISITAAVGLNWTDHCMKWNISKYGNITYLVIDPKDLWLPPVFLINRADSMEPIGKDNKFYTFVMHTGQVFYSPGGVLEARCPTDISKFPFDTQVCTLKILPWGMDVYSMVFLSTLDSAIIAFFTPHSDWKLKGYSTKTTPPERMYTIFTIEITISRQPMYYSVMIILPTLLFSAINPLVFVLPVDTGERVSLAMALLLSYAIFLTLVSASIPASSNPMCTLLLVMIVIITISGVIVTGSILSVKLYCTERDVKIRHPVRAAVIFILRKKQNADPGVERNNTSFSGKEVSKALDSVFFYGSYISIAIIVAAYFIFVLT